MRREDSTYHEQPEEAFNSTPGPLPEGFAFADYQPPPDPDFELGGLVRPGLKRVERARR